MSDAVIWLARQPIDVTGEVFIVSDLRARGVIRPELLHRDVVAAGVDPVGP